jgi:dTDP-4-amino-4,6-dideoxygalactose transaminase
VARPTLIPFVDLKAQHIEIREELDAAIAQVIDAGQFVLGPQVEAFERKFAEHCGVTHAVGTNSGTSALHLALLAAGVGPGHEVITVSLTFWATVAAVLYTGATPVLVDVDPKTCNMDPAAFERAITKRTKAVLPVHLYGRCADMDAITAIAGQHEIVVVEDAAQAVGSSYKGRQAGSLGDIACFSFYPAKNLGAIGEGGIVVTNNQAYAERVRVLRDHGSRQKYSHEVLGYNNRLDAIQGAALLVKLKRIDRWNEARERLARDYRRLIEGVALLDRPEDRVENHHIFPAFSPRRDALRRHLRDEGIETGIHYPIPAHLQPAFSHLGLGQVGLAQTERICSQVLSLPMHAHLGAEDVDRVVASIKTFSERGRVRNRST